MICGSGYIFSIGMSAVRSLGNMLWREMARWQLVSLMKRCMPGSTPAVLTVMR